MKVPSRILILSPFGVFPPRSGGHSAILEPARVLARTGMQVTLFGYGIRRFEALRHLRPFLRPIEPNLNEYRYVSVWNWVDYWQRRRTGIPPVNAAKFVSRSDPGLLRVLFNSADVVQYETPWLFPYFPVSKPRVLIAHNVEGDLVENAMHIPDFVRERIACIERQAWRGADTAICYTRDDRDGLISRYGDRESHVLPIGIDTSSINPATHTQRAAARRKLRVEGKFVVLFTGSWHLPNRNALARMDDWSRQFVDPDVIWVAAGSVGQRSKSSMNFIQTGELSSLEDWFQAADCSINPLVEGSGMNVKLLESLARGLPAVTTAFGARGIELRDGVHALIRNVGQFVQTVTELKADPDLRRVLSRNARRLVETQHAWDIIGRNRLALLQSLVSPACRVIAKS